MTSCRRYLILVMGALALVAGIVGYYFYNNGFAPQHQTIQPFNGTVLSPPRNISQFSLVGIDDQPFDNGALQGRWTLLFFGFTQCGGVCPTAMAELRKMVSLLREQSVDLLPRVVMVTLDPKRDTSLKLARYVHAFDPSFYGARGSAAAIHALTHELGVAYTKVSNLSGDVKNAYNIEHTGTIMLFNSKGKLILYMTTPHHAEKMVEDYLRLIKVRRHAMLTDFFLRTRLKEERYKQPVN